MSKLQQLRSDIKASAKNRTQTINVKGSYFKATVQPNGVMSMEPVSVEEIVATELTEETPVPQGSKYSQFIDDLMSQSLASARADIKTGMLQFLGIADRGRNGVELSSWSSDKDKNFPHLVSTYCASFFDDLIKDFDEVLNKKRFREKLALAVEKHIDSQIHDRVHSYAREVYESVIKEVRDEMNKQFKPKIAAKLKKQVAESLALQLGVDEFIEEETPSEQPVQA